MNFSLPLQRMSSQAAVFPANGRSLAMAFFSVIIPTYNRAALLREALDSVFTQTLNDYEVIVVDDGSTDDTEAMVRNYPGKIQLLKQKNIGPGAARNAGVAAAVGEYVAFLDSDDLWFPWTLATYKTALDRCSQTSFVCGNCVKFSRNVELVQIRQTGMELERFPDYYSAWESNIWIGTCGTAIRRESFLKRGGYHNTCANAEDSDLWMNLGTEPGFVHLRSPLIFGYRETPGSVSSAGSKTYKGLQKMVTKEQNDGYPGGKHRGRERRQILTRHVRGATMGCLKSRDLRSAWWLYRESFWWHIGQGRIRFLTAFPLLCLKQMIAA